VTRNRKVLSLAEAERRGVVMAGVPSSCEWDGCDRQTAALRWSHAQGSYLAACLSHAIVRVEADESQASRDSGALPAQDREMDAPLSRGGGSVARETPRRTPNGEPRTATSGRRTGQTEGWRMVGADAGGQDPDLGVEGAQDGDQRGRGGNLAGRAVRWRRGVRLQPGVQDPPGATPPV
jgi:hypothetical protein